MDPVAILKKVEADRDRLHEECTALEGAMPSKQACEELVKYVEAQPEPFSDSSNPWTRPTAAGGGCCIVM